MTDVIELLSRVSDCATPEQKAEAERYREIVKFCNENNVDPLVRSTMLNSQYGNSFEGLTEYPKCLKLLMSAPYGRFVNGIK